MLASSNGSRTDPHSGYAHCRAISAGVALSSLSAAEAYAELMGTSILTADSTAKKPCQVHRSVVGSILYLGEGLLAVDRKRTEEQRLAATRRPRARRRGSLQEHTRQRRRSTINGGSKSAGSRRSARRRRRGAWVGGAEEVVLPDLLRTVQQSALQALRMVWTLRRLWRLP